MLHFHAVHADVAVADQLASGPDRRRELGAEDDHVEAALEQTDEVLRSIALHAGCFDIVLLELFLGDVAVIALQLLLGAQLNAVIADLALAALAVLAGAIFAAVHRALGTSEDILAHAAVELVFGAGALRHVVLQLRIVSLPEPRRRLLKGAERDHRFTGVQDQLRAAHC